jgi:hypothetical protein
VQDRVGVDDHRAKFEAIESLAVSADAPMLVEDWPAVGKLHGERDQAEQRQPQEDRGKSETNIEIPLAGSTNGESRIAGRPTLRDEEVRMPTR